MKVIISMAGLGNRFKERGFNTPKHLIKIKDKTLIEMAIETLNMDCEYIFIIRKEENKDNTDLINLLNKVKKCTIIEIDYLTEGPASSAYLAKELLDPEEELIITNSDQILEWDSEYFLNECIKYDCCVLTYSSSNPKNSFILLNKDNNNSNNNSNNIIQIVEKQVVSDIALVGLHYFKKSKYFIENYEDIYSRKEKTNNEYYLSNVCNNMIKYYKVGHVLLKENEKYHSTGTPEDYFKYLNYINETKISIFKLEDMYRGWFIGNFEPSVSKQETFEVGYLLHKKGEIWDTHYHNNIKEINLLVSGKMILNDITINKNEIFIIDSKTIASPIFLEDSYIVCVKIPCFKGDKIII